VRPRSEPHTVRFSDKKSGRETGQVAPSHITKVAFRLAKMFWFAEPRHHLTLDGNIGKHP
jgi:hypothetical protein